MTRGAAASGDLGRLLAWWLDRSGGRSRVNFLIDANETTDQVVRDVDRAIDAGSTLLLVASDDLQIPARIAIAQVANSPASSVVRDDEALNDIEWMREVAAIRDHSHDTEQSQAIDALAEALTRAADRRTPVIFDGVALHAAAVRAMDPDISRTHWWIPASSSIDPAIQLAQRTLNLTPALDLHTDGCGQTALQSVNALLDLLNPTD